MHLIQLLTVASRAENYQITYVSVVAFGREVKGIAANLCRKPDVVKVLISCNECRFGKLWIGPDNLGTLSTVISTLRTFHLYSDLQIPANIRSSTNTETKYIWDIAIYFSIPIPCSIVISSFTVYISEIVWIVVSALSMKLWKALWDTNSWNETNFLKLILSSVLFFQTLYTFLVCIFEECRVVPMLAWINPLECDYTDWSVEFASSAYMSTLSGLCLYIN